MWLLENWTNSSSNLKIRSIFRDTNFKFGIKIALKEFKDLEIAIKLLRNHRKLIIQSKFKKKCNFIMILVLILFSHKRRTCYASSCHTDISHEVRWFTGIFSFLRSIFTFESFLYFWSTKSIKIIPGISKSIEVWRL